MRNFHFREYKFKHFAKLNAHQIYEHSAKCFPLFKRIFNKIAWNLSSQRTSWYFSAHCLDSKICIHNTCQINIENKFINKKTFQMKLLNSIRNKINCGLIFREIHEKTIHMQKNLNKSYIELTI